MINKANVRTLLITRNFPPLVGGMERLNRHISIALAKAGAFSLIGPAGCGAFAPARSDIVEIPYRPLPRFLAGSWFAARRARGADLVLAGSGLTAPIARHAAARQGSRFAVYVHGLDLVAPHPVYQAFWLPAIRAADRVIANSRNTARIAVERGIDPTRLRVVNPGTDLEVASAGDQLPARASLGLGEGPVLLSVGRLTSRKGLVPFVRDALPLLVAECPQIQLVIVGSDATNAVAGHKGSERERILAQAEQAGVASNVRMLGNVDEPALDALYRSADVHVFPVRDLPGDVEGFGMVALEAAARGVPTLGYAVGGVPDAVEHGVTGALVAPDDARALADATLAWLAQPRGPTRNACMAFAQRNGWDTFETRLLDALA